MDEVISIILNYNDWDRAIDLAIKNSGFSSIGKVIIVDNCSSTEPDKSKLLLNNRIEIIKAPNNGGFAKGNNFGLNYAKKYKAQYIMFTNTDTIYDNDIIVKCVEIMNHNEKLGIVSPLMFNMDNKEQITSRSFPSIYGYFSYCLYLKRKKRSKLIKEKKFIHDNEIEYTDVLRGSFLFCSKKAILEVGGFDEGTFLFGEESNLALRMERNGYKRALITSIKYFHNHVNRSTNKSVLFEFKETSKSWFYHFRVYRHASIFAIFVMKLFYLIGLLEINMILCYKKALKRN